MSTRDADDTTHFYVTVIQTYYDTFWVPGKDEDEAFEQAMESGLEPTTREYRSTHDSRRVLRDRTRARVDPRVQTAHDAHALRHRSWRPPPRREPGPRPPARRRDHPAPGLDLGHLRDALGTKNPSGTTATRTRGMPRSMPLASWNRMSAPWKRLAACS